MSDFIPDAQFVADQTPVQNSGASGDFIPDDQFQSDEDKFGGVTGGIKSFAAGAARGATFGLSDQALTHSGLVNPETLKGLQETNPISSFAGELSGIVAPALVGEEAGLANLPGLVTKGGHAVEAAATKVLPQALAKGAGFATEGALYGAGNAISENALGDHDLASEKTLADIGFSAALMGGFGTLLGGTFGKAIDASSGEEKLAAQNISKETDPLSAEGALASLNMPASEKLGLFEGLRKQKANAKEIMDAGEAIGAPVLPGQTSASKIIQDATSSLSKTPSIPGVLTQQAIQRGVDAVDQTIKESLGASEHLSPYDAGALVKEQVQNQIDKIYEPLRAKYAERAALGETIALPDKARLKLYDSLVDASQKFGSVGSEGSKVIRDLAERALSQDTVSQMDQLISEIGQKQRSYRISGEDSLATAAGQVNDALREFQVGEIAKQGKSIAKEGVEGAEQLANEAIEQHRELTKQYREFKEILSDLSSDQRLGRKLSTHGRVEMVLDDIPNEKIIDKMFDPKNADGLKRLQDRFPDVFKTIVDQKKSQILQGSMEDGRVKIGKVLNQLYDEKRLSSKVRDMMFPPEQLTKMNAAKTWMESLPKDINPSGTSKAEAFREFLTNPIKATAQNFLGYTTKKLIETFATNPAEAAKMLALINAEKAAQKTTKKINSGIESILNKSARPITAKILSKIGSAEEYDKKTNQIKEAVNNPGYLQDLMQKSIDPIALHAPNFTGALQFKMTGGMSFLESKIPQTSPVGVFNKKMDTSQADISAFNRYYTIVENPLHALEQLKSGMLVPETMETLGTVYPKLYDEMKQSLMNGITKLKDPSTLPYRTKMSISDFMGQPLDATLAPQSVAANQASFQSLPQPGPQMGGQKSSLKGVREMKTAGRFSLHPQEEA